MIPQLSYTKVFDENNYMIANQSNEFIKFLLTANEELKRKNKSLKQSLKKTRELLHEAKTQANQSETVKNEFLAQISHEIRTPLNIIINYTDLIKDELSEYITEETELFFNAIEVDSKRLIRTIDLLLNISVLKNGNYKPSIENFDVVNTLASAVADFRIEAQDKNLDLIFENTAYNKIVSADRYAVQQVFVNLISNAIKFTEHGHIKIQSYNEGQEVCINIEDTGQGISDEYLNKLFEPFTQEDHGLSRRHDGNGLGLAVVKRYLQFNDSTLSVESRKGHGSVFIVKFKTMWE